MAPPQEHAPRSWCALQTDLGDIILRRLEHHADRVRFGAVCRQWRSCARRNAPPARFPWLALPDRTFYSVPDSAFQPPVPRLHLERHRQLPHAQSSCGEWLVFERMDGAYTLVLVRPFSVSTTMVLPRLPTDTEPPTIMKLVVCSPNLVAAVVWAGEGWPHKLALCRPGAASSSSWVVVAHDQLRLLDDMIWYRGKLYALQGTLAGGSLLRVSIALGEDGEPAVSRVDDVIAEGPRWRFFAASPLQYLLESESDGALLMVRREDPNVQGHRSHFLGLGLEKVTKFKVFEADLARSRWRELSSVGEDQVVFVQRWCSRAVRVPDQCKEYVAGDRIFFVDDFAARDYNCCSFYRKSVFFYCSIYDMRKRRSQTYLATKVRPLKGFPVAWLFRGSDSEPACMNN